MERQRKAGNNFHGIEIVVWYRVEFLEIKKSIFAHFCVAW
jgi:hypothetical protein